MIPAVCVFFCLEPKLIESTPPLAPCGSQSIGSSLKNQIKNKSNFHPYSWQRVCVRVFSISFVTWPCFTFLRNKRTGSSQATLTQVVKRRPPATSRSRRTRHQGLPTSVVKATFSHFCRLRVSKEAIEEVQKMWVFQHTCKHYYSQMRPFLCCTVCMRTEEITMLKSYYHNTQRS